VNPSDTRPDRMACPVAKTGDFGRHAMGRAAYPPGAEMADGVLASRLRRRGVFTS
jgi:hypothetical protein